MPLKTSEMQGAGLYAGEIMQGVTPKSQFGEQEKGIQRSETTLPDGV